MSADQSLDTLYLVWSNEHRLWWRANSSGYTTDMRRAGRYTREEAISICRGRDQDHGKPLPELPIREDDALRIIWNPATYPITKGASATEKT